MYYFSALYRCTGHPNSLSVFLAITMNMKKRTYSESEMSSLLERAAKLQAQAAQNADVRSGLSFEELEIIAAEAGLDPIHLRQAAAELFNTSEPTVAQRSTGATHIYVDRWVAAELNDEGWEEIEAELRHRFDSGLSDAMSGGMAKPGIGIGESSKVGRSRQWKHVTMSGVETRVIAQPRGESVQLKLSQRVGMASTVTEGVMYGGAIALIFGLVMGEVFLGGGKFAVLMAILLSAAFFMPAVGWLDKKWREKKHGELEKISDNLAAILKDHPVPVADKAEMTYEDAEVDMEAMLQDVESAHKATRIDPSLLVDTEEKEGKTDSDSARNSSKKRQKDK